MDYQPVTTMPGGVTVAFSAVSDGSIAAGGGRPDTEVHRDNMRRFITTYFGAPEHTKVFVTYLPENTYHDVARVTRVNANQPIKADALFTTESDIVIALPVADCIATVVYDPLSSLLGVLHLGRHASVAGLIETFTAVVTDQTQTNPKDWHVWMSPSLKQDHDRMTYFTPPHAEQWQQFMRPGGDSMIHIDVAGHNHRRFIDLGVAASNIYVSPINTYEDTRYFSHRAAIERDDPSRAGRMTVAAAIVDQTHLLQ